MATIAFESRYTCSRRYLEFLQLAHGPVFDLCILGLVRKLVAPLDDRAPVASVTLLLRSTVTQAMGRFEGVIGPCTNHLCRGQSNQSTKKSTHSMGSCRKCARD
jgi:hypothetical protein